MGSLSCPHREHGRRLLGTHVFHTHQKRLLACQVLPHTVYTFLWHQPCSARQGLVTVQAWTELLIPFLRPTTAGLQAGITLASSFP